MLQFFPVIILHQTTIKDIERLIEYWRMVTLPCSSKICRLALQLLLQEASVLELYMDDEDVVKSTIVNSVMPRIGCEGPDR